MPEVGEIYISPPSQGNRIIQICYSYEPPKPKKGIVYRYLDTPTEIFGSYATLEVFNQDFSEISRNDLEKYSHIIKQKILNY